MYKHLYKFLNDINILYELQFGFRKSFSTTHALINLTENIRQVLDDGKIGWGIFVDDLKTRPLWRMSINKQLL